MPEYAIETAALRREFGRHVAVAGLSLAVPRGEVFGFLGPTGAGKTTSLKLLLGLVAPTSGAVRVRVTSYTGEKRAAPRSFTS
jgi:ABC-2 type transport system ATP-binding protein